MKPSTRSGDAPRPIASLLAAVLCAAAALPPVPARAQADSTALGWLAVTGPVMLVEGSLVASTPMHLFDGFALCFVYALGAHMLPRFTGQPIRGGAWSNAQLACANAGIALFALGLPFAGGALLWLSLALFTVRLWPVLRPLTRH